MQKKLMLRPTAVPSENLPTEMTNYSSTERSDSPENTTSSSFVSLDHTSDSNSGNVVQTTQQVITIANNNNNNNIINNNNHHHNHHNDYHHHHHHHQDEVKLNPENYQYHPTTTPIVQTTTIATSASFQASTYETLLTPLSTVPYQEITEEPMYMLSDGTEIDRNRLSSVLNRDDYGDGTITYVVNFVDY